MSNIKIKRILILFFIIIISMVFFCFKEANGAYIETDINKINENKYPGYKTLVQKLKAEHPSWNFQFYFTELEWEEVIVSECQGHGKSPMNLSPANDSRYDGMWICPFCQKEIFDSGKWYCASEYAIKYMMDPRNSINNSDIFQFQDLSSNEVNRKNIENMVSGTFLDDEEVINAVIKASNDYGINGYYIVARILQEQGENGSTLSLGNGYNGNYVGIYNFFNFGATGNGTSDSVIMNGLKYAYNQGWNTKTKAIIGGAELIAKKYIALGQNTLYFQKFNVVTENMYSHQYMQNILAAQNEGTKLRKEYQNIDSSLTSTYTFLIPVYENMPKKACDRPLTSEELNVPTIDATVNVNGSLKLRALPLVSGRLLNSISNGVVVKIFQRAAKKSEDGYYWDKVITPSGSYGYMARESLDGSKTYLITNGEDLPPIDIIPDEPDNPPEENPSEDIPKNPDDNLPTSYDDVKFSTSKVNITPDVKISDLNKLYEIDKIVDKNNKPILDDSKIGTGAKITIEGKEYTVVKKGDTNGDGEITIIDTVVMLNHLKGSNVLDNEFADAALLKSNNEITIIDVVTLINYLKGNINLTV